MEKLVYVLWRSARLDRATFRDRVLDCAKHTLPSFGGRRISVNVADEHAAAAAHMRMTHLPAPIDATLSVWLDTHLARKPMEEALTSLTSRMAGYLVLESMPIVNDARLPDQEGRIDCLCTVALLEKPAGMDHEAWREQWQGHHTGVAVETQSTFLYIQNLVVRPLAADQPAWTAIVEECFPVEAATDPMVFYDARGSKERLQQNQLRMIESCQKFIDFSTLELHPMSPYVLDRQPRQDG